MSPSRRTLLKASLPVALGGAGLGYWQRRRIGRRDDLEALEQTAALETPSVDEPLIVPSEVVQAGYEDARDHLEQTEELANEVPEDTTIRGLEGPLNDASEGLEANPPAEMETDGERRGALESYRSAIANSGQGRGLIITETHDTASAHEDFQERLDEAKAVDADLEISYTGDAFTTAIVQYGVLDERVTRASERLERTDERMSELEEPTPGEWSTVGKKRFELDTANRYTQALDGADLTGAFDSGYDALVDRTESVIDETSFDLEEDVRNYAFVLVRSVIDAERTAESAHGSGHYARAIRDQSQALVVAKALEVLADVPADSNIWNEHASDLPSTGAELLAAFEEAKTELEAAIAAVGDDPLGRWLLEEATWNLDGVQSRVERLREDVRSDEDDEWERRIIGMSIRCRRSQAYWAAVPAVLERVQSFDPT